MTSIIPAKPEHLKGLAGMFDAYRVFYHKEPQLEGAWEFLKARMELQDSEIFVAKDSHDGQLRGFVQLYPLYSSTRMCRLWLLNDLYVKPEFRGKGISKLLIERAKILAKETNAAGLMLETEKSNAIGNRLYPRTGFELESGHNYYFWANLPYAG